MNVYSTVSIVYTVEYISGCNNKYKMRKRIKLIECGAKETTKTEITNNEDQSTCKCIQGQ